MSRPKGNHFERFLSKVDKRADGCWRWTDPLTSRGVGLFAMEGVTWIAHRASCLLHGITIPKWTKVYQTCSKRWCVNPDHIKIVPTQNSPTPEIDNSELDGVHPDIQRLLKRVTKQSDGCWIWTGTLNCSGSGIISFHKKTWLVHRLSCRLHGMPLQSWHCVFHTCLNKLCINPEHMELTTRHEFSIRRHNIAPKPGWVKISVPKDKYRLRIWVSPTRAKKHYEELQRKQDSKKKYLCQACGKVISILFTHKKYCGRTCQNTAYAHLRHKERRCARCQKVIEFKKNASFRHKFCGKACCNAAQGEHLAFANPYRRAKMLRGPEEEE